MLRRAAWDTCWMRLGEQHLAAAVLPRIAAVRIVSWFLGHVYVSRQSDGLGMLRVLYRSAASLVELSGMTTAAPVCVF
jgi:hypothetical protein